MEPILLSAIVGAGGMGLGGFIAAIIGKRSPSMGSYLLAFAGGVMTGVVSFGLIPESMELSNTALTIAGLIIGVLFVMMLNRIIDKTTVSENDKLKIHHTPDEFYHTCGLDTSRLLQSGMIILGVIAIHNIPEGIAIGAGGSHDYSFGLSLAVMLAVHNIPEGMAIAASLIFSGMQKWKVILFSTLAGATTSVGAVMGIFVGGISDTALALALSSAGGAMLYVVFGEIIPQSIIMTKSRVAAIVALSGIILGLIVAQI